MVFRVVGERGACYFFQAELPYDVQTYPYSGALEAITVVCCVRACVCACVRACVHVHRAGDCD
eukprot:COSAG02_NODE_410_length_22875_cov_43.282755_18_plen_63_part_00